MWRVLKFYARHNYNAVYRLQREKLLDNQKQKKDHGTPGNEEILPSMPGA
jgi:hypothetical protein